MKLLPDIYGHQAIANRIPMVSLAFGVVGLRVDVGQTSYFPLISAVEEGKGDVGRFLDSQPVNTTWKVPTVVNVRLVGMLKRRDFKLGVEYDPDEKCLVDVWWRTR